jgi:hypothetical protein
MHNIDGNKNELALRAFNANQVIYGANSSVDDDVIGIMKIHIWSYLYKNVRNPEKNMS